MTNPEAAHSRRPRSEKSSCCASLNYLLDLSIPSLAVCDSFCSAIWHWPQFPQIEIVLGKSDKFDELMAAAAEERGEVEDGEEQQA